MSNHWFIKTQTLFFSLPYIPCVLGVLTKGFVSDFEHLWLVTVHLRLMMNEMEQEIPEINAFYDHSVVKPSTNISDFPKFVVLLYSGLFSSIEYQKAADFGERYPRDYNPVSNALPQKHLQSFDRWWRIWL